uniref:Uncharacterized protein n=1 Tax=Nothobranchius korthausae TaxID=1143690 RepID=A0A1A8F5X9_9TELE
MSRGENSSHFSQSLSVWLQERERQLILISLSAGRFYKEKGEHDSTSEGWLLLWISIQPCEDLSPARFLVHHHPLGRPALHHVSARSPTPHAPLRNIISHHLGPLIIYSWTIPRLIPSLALLSFHTTPLPVSPSAGLPGRP